MRVLAATVGSALASDPGPEDAADLVFLDPPYDVGEEALAAVLARLAAGWLAPHGSSWSSARPARPSPHGRPGSSATGSRAGTAKTTLWSASVPA